MPAGLDYERLVAPIVERFGDEPDREQLRAAARAGDDEKARYWKDRARQAMAEGDETGPDA